MKEGGGVSATETIVKCELFLPKDNMSYMEILVTVLRDWFKFISRTLVWSLASYLSSVNFISQIGIIIISIENE